MKPRELAALSNARVYPDGSMSFAVERTDGQEFEISCSQLRNCFWELSP
jgi:hypothetical protein